MDSRATFGVLSLALAVTLGGCGSPAQPEAPAPEATPTVAPPAAQATADYIELGRIARISRFRSGVGHDYSGGGESCRSMKHYFVPASYPVKIFSPVSGTVGYLTQEWAGTQVGIQSGARTFIVFHVSVLPSITVGTSLTAGQQIGTHVGSQTWSDIAVREGDQLLSYFEVMKDAVFQSYRSRGVGARGELIISQAARDAEPLTCNGDSFAGPGSIPNWIDLD
jgi:hypothetical protein